MNFGIMMIWNWIIGLVLLFPVLLLAVWICEKKYGKDVMKTLCGNEVQFDAECLFASAIIGLLWETALPMIIHILVLRAKDAYKSMHQ